jgi:hypothetical protein
MPRTIAERLERLAPHYAKAAFKNMHLCFSIAAYTTKPSGIESCAFPIFWLEVDKTLKQKGTRQYAKDYCRKA